MFSLLDPVNLLEVYATHATYFDTAAEQLADIRQTMTAKISAPKKVAASDDIVRMMLGGLSAVVAQSIVQPIETAKVRLQNDTQNPRKYKNLPQTFVVIFNEENLRGFWKGMAPSALRELSYSTLRFGLYTPLKNLINGPNKKETLWSKILSGGMAGGIGSAIASPLDLLKISAQANPKKGMSPMETAKKIVKENGVLALWRGTSTTVARAVTLGSVKLASYDEIKVQLQTLFKMDPKGSPVITLASVATGLLVTFVSAPIDFARTRIMSGKRPDGTPYSSGLDVLRRAPLPHWYRGFFPQWARIAPYTLIQFWCWEKMCHFVGIRAV